MINSEYRSYCDDFIKALRKKRMNNVDFFHIYYANVTYFPSLPAELSVIICIIAKKKIEVSKWNPICTITLLHEGKQTLWNAIFAWPSLLPLNGFFTWELEATTANLYWRPLSCSAEKAEKWLTQRYCHVMDCSLSKPIWSSIKPSGCWWKCCFSVREDWDSGQLLFHCLICSSNVLHM